MSRQPFEYAVLRAVPRVDRGEFVNVGVMLYCQASNFLAARTRVDAGRLLALDAAADVAAVEAALATVAAACAGDPSAGPVAQSPAGVRFRWLASPRSTVVQSSPVHSGLTQDPAQQLSHLFAQLVQ
ncbi:MAG: DUF3037 domain-containing protein [Actinomycetota bacterium]|jgi:hypothetical protein|nr:DUF3037 domain-containing protein [Actinomycetota bacterium]